MPTIDSVNSSLHLSPDPSLHLSPYLPLWLSLAVWLGALAYFGSWWSWLGSTTKPQETAQQHGTQKPHSAAIKLVLPLLLCVFSATSLYVGMYCRGVNDEFICTMSEFPLSGRITVPDVELHAGPIDDSQITAKLNSGELVKILAKDGPWAQIELLNGRRGWIRRESVLREVRRS